VMTKKSALEYFPGMKNVTKKVRERALEVMKHEVETYDSYITGDVYYYKIEGLDTCYGFIGSDHEKSGLLATARSVIDSQEKEQEDGES